MYYKGKSGKSKKLNFKSTTEILCVSIKLVPVDTCTRQQAMQDDNSAALTEHLDGRTILVDVCQIQGQTVHFDELGDVFVQFVNIQGRIWVFTRHGKFAMLFRPYFISSKQPFFFL